MPENIDNNRHKPDLQNKERINISISKDEMMALVVYNLTQEELDFPNREKLIKETASKLKERDIVFGIKSNVFFDIIVPGMQYVIAEGIMPENGRDSVIKMFDLIESKPEAIENEKMDYYNLSLITTVDAGTWLGERDEATEGVDGRSVKGEKVNAIKGITFPLHYDKEMVYEVHENGRDVLYSKVYGAVFYSSKGISLMNPLIINGDVDFKTGNIMFDGYVIINGTICDGFYVEATNNIEVNGELGLGNVKGIVSKKGSIYVKGGILSKGATRIEAAKNVYIKFIENVTVNCGGTAHIGFYSSNSTINAKEVIIDSLNGKIIGGVTKALTRVISPVIGSEIGKKTAVEVAGFNRAAINAEVNTIIRKIDNLKSEYEREKQRINSYSARSNLTSIQDRILKESKDRIDEIHKELKKLAEEKESYDSFLKTRCDGEIHVTKRIYPNTSITLNGETLEITSEKYSTTFVSQGKRLLQL